MTLPIGSLVTIAENAVHPRLSGRTGVVVHVTKAAKCYGANWRVREPVCGGNPILEVEGVGRVLVPKGCVAMIEDGEMAA